MVLRNKPDISDQPGLNPIRRHSIDARSKVSGYLGEKLQQQKTEVYDSDEESSINPYDAYVNQSKLGLSLDERRDKSNWYHGETRTSDKKYDIERKYDDSIDARSNPHRNPMTTELGKANNDFNEFKKNYTTALGKLNIKTGELVFINAGHESILTFDQNKNYEYIKSEMPPIGIVKYFTESMVKSNTINLKDKTFVVYTDGVTEGYMKNGEELGAEGVQKIINEMSQVTPKSIVEAIEKELNWGAEKLRDDITCMAININNTELIKKK